MGYPIARNLTRAGFRVRAWNRSSDKVRELAGEGARGCDTPAEAVEGAGVVLTMLSDMNAVLQSMDAALPGLAAGTVWLQMSTIGETGTERCMELAEENQLTLIDAPVLGTKQPAEEGKLVVLASGPEQVIDRLEPLFAAIGQRTMRLGEAGMGSRLKLVANSWVLSVTEACAEAIALAEGLGLEPSLLFDAVEGGALDLPYLRIKGRAILERKLAPAFRLSLAAKDAGLVDESARQRGLDLPMFSAVHRQMSEAAKTHGDKDMAATYFASAPPESSR
jgi:3-hydroxyisobutyrate dehydrogenase